MKNILVLFISMMALTAFAQERKPVTTFILLRHAEKDLTQSTNDPDLSTEGKERAIKLVSMFKQSDVHAVYSTDYKRTRQTVEPLATARVLTIQLYDARKNSDIDTMLQKHAGQTIVVSGHSNTVPSFVNYLIGEMKYQPMGDGEYGNIIIVSLTERGKDAKVVWLTY